MWLSDSRELINVDDNSCNLLIDSNTGYIASTVENFVLVQKSEITKISVDSGKDPSHYSNYSNAEIKIDMSNCKDTHLRHADSIDPDTAVCLHNQNGFLDEYANFKPYMNKFVESNTKSIDFTLNPTPSDANEYEMIQDLYSFIKNNSSLESVSMSISDSSNCVSILDACRSKPKIDEIILNCSNDLSNEVKKFVQQYKQENIFKSVQIYITVKKEEETSSSRCVIF